MEYRGVGRFPGNVPRFRYPRPGVPMPRPHRALLAMPPRARFESPRPVRSRFYTPSPRGSGTPVPRGSIHMPFRGFKATPMIPRSLISETGRDSENKPGKASSNTDLSGANDDSKIPKQTDSNVESSKMSDSSNTAGNSKEQSETQGSKALSQGASQDSRTDETSNEGATNKDLNSGKTVNKDSNFSKPANKDSYVKETANQKSYSHDRANQKSYSHDTSNQGSLSHGTANQDSYSHETANQDSYSKQVPHQESNQDSYPGYQEDTGPNPGDKKADGGGTNEEEESDDEDTGFCQFCSMSFDSDEAYWKHTRGLLHTQKVMEAEKTKADMGSGSKDFTVPDSTGSTKMENQASEKDLQYLQQTGFRNYPGIRGRGGYQSPSKDFSRGYSEQGYSQGQGQNDRGNSGRGRGQGFNRYGKNFSDYNMTSMGQQRPAQEQEEEGYSGYGENEEYQEYGGEENYEEGYEDYSGGGDYGDSGDYGDNQQEEGNTDGQGEEEYSFNSSNWMDLDKPPERVPVSERDIDPDTLGKPQFPIDFYCKTCDVRCTSQKNLEMHMEGTRHKIKAMQGNGEAKEDNKKKKVVLECSNRPSKVEHIIRKSDLPIVGLQYVTEFQKADSSARPSYVCNLCESKCDMNTVLAHVTGFKHRLNYFRENHKDIYEHMTSNSTKKKSEQNASAEEFAADCMKKDGQGKIRVKLEIDPTTEALAASILSQSGITFISDLKTKSGPSLPEKKPRATPVPNRQENFGTSYDRGYNKRSSDSQYDFPSKHPRGPGTSDSYGEAGGNKVTFDYNHKGTPRGYPGGEDQFSPYPSTPRPQQMGYTSDTRTPGTDRAEQAESEEEDKELFKEFLEWKRQQKKKASQVEPQHPVQPSATEKKAAEEVNPADAPGNTTAEMMFALSQTMINTEEDAAMALQVSNALTQALLQYRLKNVPKELTSGMSSAGGQTAVQTKSSESQKSGAASTSTRSVKKSTPHPPAAPPAHPPAPPTSHPAAPTMSRTGSAVSSTPGPYTQAAPSTMPMISGMVSNIAYSGTLPTGVPPVTDPLAQHMNPPNPLSTKQYLESVSSSQYPGVVSTTQYPGVVPTTQYPGAISTTQYPGAISTTQYPGVISTTQYSEYTYYGGQYQPPVPEGYQWGYNTVTQAEPPPPLPPTEDLPQPPPESQKY